MTLNSKDHRDFLLFSAEPDLIPKNTSTYSRRCSKARIRAIDRDGL